MVAYNFQKQFAPLIESGRKTQTIRALGRRRHANPGEKLQLYTGQRTKACRLLKVALCSAVLPIRMEGAYLDGCLAGVFVWLQERPLNYVEIFELAQADGFEAVAQFADFFKDRLPFEGVLIKW